MCILAHLRPGACTLLALVLALSLTAEPGWPLARSDQDPCDKELEELASGPHGYRLRGERCEGIFVQQVSGTPLYVVSFTRFFQYGDLAPRDSLVVEWPVPGNRRPVTLQAEGVRPGLHYRMDAERPPGSGSFMWPADLLAARGIERDDIGALGWTPMPIAGRQEKVFVPLAIRAKSERPSCAPYEFGVWTGPRLREVYVTIAPVTADGGNGPPVWDRRPLEWRYYPAEQPIPIPLPELASPGVYYIKVAGERLTGETSTLQAFIYYPDITETGCDG